MMEALQDLREDAVMLHAVLCNAKAPVDQVTLACLLRLSDYLNQHIQDMEMAAANEDS